MKFTYAIPFDQPVNATWEALQDPVRLIRCLPGCEGVEPAPAAAEAPASEAYQVQLTTGLGPVRLRVRGTARLRRDPEQRSVMADVSLSDSRAGSIYGTFVLTALPVEAERSEIRLEADVVLGGKMGEFAQPLLRRKADHTVREFADNLRRMN